METLAPTFPPFENDDAFRDLRDLMRGGRPPLALIGAGASAGSGYPDWRGLLKKLRKTALDRGDTLAWRKDIEDLNDALWTAEVLTRKFRKGQLSSLIKTEFGDHRRVGEPHRTLARMPFPHYLTTNYDRCIERALRTASRSFVTVRWSETNAVSDFLIGLNHPKTERRVVYLHGRSGDPDDDIVLTESDYVGRYIASDDARRKLMAIFMTNPVVFIGFSLNDPDLANLMREVTARLKTTRPSHFALMGYKTEGEREATRDRMVGKFGVRPVFFSRIPDHERYGRDEYFNLVHLLDALVGRPPRAVLPNRATRAAVAESFDPEDPNKGCFGGSSETAHRRLRVDRISGSRDEGILTFHFIVESTDDAHPLDGPVNFFLHPTFRRRVVTVTPVDGKAVLKRWAYGAFTIGVRTDDDETQLEYDLATDARLPLWFRRR